MNNFGIYKKTNSREISCGKSITQKPTWRLHVNSTQTKNSLRALLTCVVRTDTTLAALWVSPRTTPKPWLNFWNNISPVRTYKSFSLSSYKVPLEMSLLLLVLTTGVLELKYGFFLHRHVTLFPSRSTRAHFSFFVGLFHSFLKFWFSYLIRQAWTLSTSCLLAKESQLSSGPLEDSMTTKSLS